MSDEQKSNYEAVIKKSLLEIRSLKSKLQDLEAKRDEPLAIVGMGCRFPGGVTTAEEFWQLLVSGKEPRSEVPSSRWDIESFYSASRDEPGKMYTRHGYFLDSVDGFDCEAFGISPREAASLDPQQRLLLEVAWEAFADASLSPQQLNGSDTGVFLGLMNEDYLQLSTMPVQKVDVHTATGYTRSVAAGRIAHFFGLRGAAQTIDTACSSSLVALHSAATLLRAGEISAALVCGVNVMLSPRTTILECRAGMLATDGRCKAFADHADGYGRGEGCAAVVIKRLSDAVSAGDKVLAVLRSCCINHDGKSSGLTAPNGLAQEAVVRSALQRAQLSPSDITYVEAHGTGTALGDPIEVGALAEVFSGRQQPLLIGSVKTNIGHLESAAGIASLIKVVLCLNKQAIAGQLHFSQPNKNIAWDEVPIKVVDTFTPLAAGEQPLRMGVSAFGLSGTNAHAILEAAPQSLRREVNITPPVSFQRQRYWVDDVRFDDLNETQRTVASQPPIGQKLELPFSSEARFEQLLSLSSAPWLVGHALFSQVVVPGAYFLSLVAEAYDGPLQLNNVRFDAPLVLNEQQQKLQLILSGEPTAEQQFKVVSKGARDQKWELHAQGIVSPSLSTAQSSVMPQRQRDAQAIDPAEFYQALTVRGYQLGQNFRRLENLQQHGAVATAALRSKDPSVFKLSPEILDNALHLLLLASGVIYEGAGESLFVPVSIGSLQVLKLDIDYQKEQEFLCVATHDGSATEASVTGDIAIFTSSGEPLVLVSNFTARRVQRTWLAQVLGSEQQTYCYSYSWEAFDFAKEPKLGFDLQPRCLFIGDDAEVAVLLGDAMNRDSLDTIAAYDSIKETPEAYRARLHDSLFSRQYFAVFFSHRFADSAAGVSAFAAAVLPLLAVLQQSGSNGARLFFINRSGRGAHPATGDLYNGLLRVMRSESPELFVAQLELDEAAVRAGSQVVKQIALLDTAHREWVIRGETALVACLGKLIVEQQKLAQLQPSASYLITGGLGALGIRTAYWLAQRGAKKIILLARNGNDGRADALITELAARDVAVSVVQCDLRDAAQVSAFGRQLATERIEVRGIVHAAGVLRDARIDQLGVEDFSEVVLPKAIALDALLQILPREDLDFLICYSSAAGVLGNSGQGNYAAANSMLDSYVQRLRAEGMAAISLQWGPWSEAGMAQAPALLQHFEARGIKALQPTQAFALLELLLGAGTGLSLVVDIDWQKYYATRTPSQLLAKLLDVGKRESTFRDVLSQTAHQLRSTALRRFVSLQVAQVLGRKELSVEQEEQGFFEFGMDSMTSLELRNVLQLQLGVSLAATVVLEHASVSDLSAYLESKMLSELLQPPQMLTAQLETDSNVAKDDLIEPVNEISFLPELEALEKLLRQ